MTCALKEGAEGRFRWHGGVFGRLLFEFDKVGIVGELRGGWFIRGCSDHLRGIKTMWEYSRVVICEIPGCKLLWHSESGAYHESPSAAHRLSIHQKSE